MMVTVVVPREADAADGKVSLIAPLGAALLGRRSGDSVEYSAPGGEVTVTVGEVLFQPERDSFPFPGRTIQRE